jgi:uncharacterized protein YndB with AHSA1/START domain
MATAINKELTITRFFNAPPALVFKAWTDPKHLAQWWGPKGFTNPVCEVDVRPGGAINIDMTFPDGRSHPMGGTFHEVDEPHRLVFSTRAFELADGTYALEVLNTITFEELHGKTKLTVHAKVTKAGAGSEMPVAGMNQGWNESLDRLTSELRQTQGAKFNLVADYGKQDATITRTFSAPLELVFKVSTDPKHIPNWWGPRFLTTVVDKQELKTGGSWRFVQTEPGGRVHGFHGVYHEVLAPVKLVYTFEYEGQPGHVALVTDTYEEKNGKTTMTSQTIFQSVEDRDGMVNSGMEFGVAEGIERFEEILATMK